MFRVLSDIPLGPDSVRIIPITQKTKKKWSIRYLCRVRIGSDSFLLDQVRLGFLGSIYLPSPRFNGKHNFNGKLRFYDFDGKIQFWWENLKTFPNLCSIKFCKINKFYFGYFITFSKVIKSKIKLYFKLENVS